MRFVWRRLVVRDADLTDATRRVLLDLESYANADGTNARPGIKRIAEDLRTPDGKLKHISERTVRTALATGVDRGFIDLTAKAPRGRGNKRADVYRLTFPSETVGTPDEIGETQVAGIHASERQAAASPAIGETQTATNTGINSGNQCSNSGNEDPEYRQPGLPTTSSLPPDQISPGRKLSSYVSTASVREDEQAGNAKTHLDPFASLFPPARRATKPEHVRDYIDGVVVTDDIPDYKPKPQPTALEWMSLNLGGLTDDEAIAAETMLGNGISKYTVQSQINLARKPGIRARKTLHPPKDTSAPLNGAEIPTATAEKSTA